MKKTLALVLALAMVFSTITVAFAEGTLGEDAQICADLGMLQGATGTVDAAYVATAPQRYQAAVMFLRLKGLEAEALAFTGEDNFADGEIAWAEGANLIAYLKANPQLGWIGDGTNFNPTGAMTAQAYYKVLLEALGYKQTTAEVAGDFTWEEVLTFAASVGLSKVAAVENFVVNDLAIATVEALKLNVKGTEGTLVESLVAAGVVDEAKAVAAGLMEAAPAAVAVELKEAKATGNAVVEVTFKAAVDEAAANAANYSIEGIAVNSAAISGEKTVVLATEAMTKGTLYNLTVGDKTVQFTGVAKVSGGPEIDKALGEDVEEVVIEFDKNIDLATGTDVANYVINGVEIVKAEVDENEVTLTTEGLKDKTSYTVKVMNVKSVDLVARKSTSKTFKTNIDKAAPRLDTTTMDVDQPETNQRIVVYFNEEVTQESAEDIANYSIKENVTDGEDLEVISATWDSDDENFVTLVTDSMARGKNYKLSVSNISDQRKVANVMARPSTWTFKGIAEDKKAPQLNTSDVYATDKILVVYKDDSKIDEATALDINNYTFKQGSNTLDVLDAEEIRDVNGEYMVLVTVEEMEAGKSYTLKASDVCDEFGNATKDVSVFSKTVNVSDFASAKLTGVTTVGEKAIKLTFDKYLREETAENIGNYSLNNDIGTPTKATYDRATMSVKLETNALINGKSYKVTVDGVEDLGGHQLKVSAGNERKFTANSGTAWDDDAPEIQDITVLNKYVVAVQFNEEVDDNVINVSTLKLTPSVGAPINLTARAMNDDDTVVEFSIPAGLTKDEIYTVTSEVYGGQVFKDLIGNTTTTWDDSYELTGVDDEDYIQIEGYDQVNGTTFELTVSREIYTAPATIGSFGVFVDVDDAKVVRLVKSAKLTDGGDETIDLRGLKDAHGIAVENNDTTALSLFTPSYTDTDKPYIIGVNALDRTTIEVEFSEDVRAAAGTAFTLKNIDLNKTVSIGAPTYNGATKTDRHLVTINLGAGSAFEGRYEYELKMAINTIQDYAGNKVDADNYVFDGIDLTQH